MKRKIALLLALTLAVALLAGCSMPTAPDPDNVDDAGNEIQKSDEPAANSVALNSFSDDGSFAKNLTEKDRVTCDMGDKVSAEVILYTNAKDGGSGEWALLAQVDNKSFALADRQYYKAGGVSFDVYTFDDKTHILVTIHEPDGLRFDDYTYSVEKRSFVKVPLYANSNAQLIHHGKIA